MSPLPSNGSKRFRWQARAGMFALLAGLLALGAGSAIAQTANSLDALSVSKASSGRTVIKFTLKAPLPNPPAGFAIANPPRIAWAGKVNGLTVQKKLPFVRNNRARKHLDQGRFTRTIIANYGKHFAWVHL